MSVTQEEISTPNDLLSPYLLPSREIHQKTFTWLTRCSALLSFLGSSTIIYIILSDRKKKLCRLNNRILLAMSIADIINTFALGVSTAPLPRGTYGAAGNVATCSAQGFLIQLGFAGPMYNAMLCISYLLIVKYNMKEHTIKRKYETCMHAIAILYPLVTAIIGVCLDLYKSNGFFCYVVEKSLECELSGRDCGYTANYQLILGCVLIFTCSVNFATMVPLFLHVRNLENNMNKYDFRRYSLRTLPQEQSQKPSRSRETMKQALLYVLSFQLTYAPTAIAYTLVLMKHDRPGYLTVLIGISHPLLGFWNLIVYLRPRYNVVDRAAGKSMSFSRKLHAALFSSEKIRMMNTRQRRYSGEDFS